MKMLFILQMTVADMSVSILLLFLLNAVTQDAGVPTDNTLTTQQLQTVLCVWTVAHKHFAPGRPLVVSLPRTTPEVARSDISDRLSQSDGL